MTSPTREETPQEEPQQQQQPAAAEQEPLLGRPGDASQIEGKSIYRNLYTGTAIIAQVGIILLTTLIWSGILSHPWLFFSPHPLLNTAALLLQTQATLILQPTTTPPQKHQGTKIHYTLQILSIISFLSALIIIEINKGPHPPPDHPRFSSPHAIAGLVVYIGVVLQAALGVVQYFLPERVLGSVERGKRVYKFHRWFGYALMGVEVVAVSAATRTTYNVNVGGISLGWVVAAAVLVVLGVLGRVKKQKLGL